MLRTTLRLSARRFVPGKMREIGYSVRNVTLKHSLSTSVASIGRRAALGTAAIILASSALAACTIAAGQNDATQSSEQQEAKALPPVVSVDNGADEVNPAEPVVVKSVGDGLREVSMTNENGKQVKGKLSRDHRSWTTDEDLGYSRQYAVVATDENGTKTTSKFTTVAPNATVNAAMAPLDGSVVGIGQTIAMRFSTAVQDRQAAQDAVKVTTEPAVEGAWYWLSPYEMRWRPQNYWKPGTKVSVDAKLYGADLGGGEYGDDDYHAAFTIGDKVTAEVNDATKTMTILKNDQPVKTMPISLGANQWPTPNGVYIIGDKNPTLVMDSETYGLAHNKGGYRVTVDYATQMSYSGIYVHAAPWSVWAQGSQNTSHGCVNVSTADAKWFQDFVKRGDIVEVKNTIGGTLDGYDGLGDWNIPWKTWKEGNAKG